MVKENRGDQPSDSATYSLIAKKLGCSLARFASGVSRRSVTSANNSDGAVPTMPVNQPTIFLPKSQSNRAAKTDGNAAPATPNAPSRIARAKRFDDWWTRD